MSVWIELLLGGGVRRAFAYFFLNPFASQPIPADLDTRESNFGVEATKKKKSPQLIVPDLKTHPRSRPVGFNKPFPPEISRMKVRLEWGSLKSGSFFLLFWKPPSIRTHFSHTGRVGPSALPLPYLLALLLLLRLVNHSYRAHFGLLVSPVFVCVCVETFHHFREQIHPPPFHPSVYMIYA